MEMQDVSSMLSSLNETAIAQELARRRLKKFLEFESNGAWMSAPHLDLLCEKLEAVERGELRRLIVCMPPRHGKSEVVSKKFPAWFLGRNPDAEMILAGYGAGLALDFSYIARNTLRAVGPQLWGVDVAKDSGATGRWRVGNHRGGVVAAGVGGAITGRGAQIAIVDDPFGSWEDALSDNQRRLVWEWYQTTLRTRLTPTGTIILVMTRWHVDDLVGRLIKHMQNDGVLQWEVINLPAIAGEDDLLHREVGQALWPQRFSLENLEETRADMGPFKFGAMYQQNPQSTENAVFKAEWLSWYTQTMIQSVNGTWFYNSEPLEIFGGIDLAMSERNNADEFCFVTIGKTATGKIIVLDSAQGHFNPDEQYRITKAAYAKWGHKLVEVETNQGQVYFYNTMSKQIPMRPKSHSTSKYGRISDLSPLFEQGRVYLREALDEEGGFDDPFRIQGRRVHHVAWPIYEQYVTYNSNISHDDRMDALEMAIDLAKDGQSEIIAPGLTNGVITVEPLNGMENLQAGFGSKNLFVERKPGDILPTPVLTPRKQKDPVCCATCGKPYTRRRGVSGYFCPEHGWSGNSGIPTEYMIIPTR